MNQQLVRAELFKFRSTKAWWVYAAASVISTVVVLIVNAVNARALLKPFDQYVVIENHGHTDAPPADFLSHLKADWLLGHDAVTQASTLFTSGQLIGLLLSCLLGIVLVTSEFQHQTATTTFLTTPARSRVIVAKLKAAVIVAAVTWLVSTVICLIGGIALLNSQGYGTQLGDAGVLRAIGLNLVAYVLWAAFGVGFGALIRSQLGATISATVLYLVGATAASSVFGLVNTYVIKHDWVLTAQTIMPAVASTVMISPTKTFDQSPHQWVGALVLIAWTALFGLLGLRYIRRRDIA